MPNIDELLQGARDAITVKRVYGDPIESEGVTIVPAAVVRGGGGGGGDDENNGGGGFGLHARPAGAWIIRDGDASWKPAIDLNRVALLAFVLGLAFARRRR
ncbi:MAG: sporulation protein [Gaiellaceae bacterium]